MAGPSTIAQRLEALHGRLAEAETRAGREPGCVRLVLVTKNASVGDITEASQAGHEDFGENYVKAAREKMGRLEGRGIRWHMVGQLQSNKAAWAARNFDLIHSLATLSAARAAAKALSAAGGCCKALVQIRLGGGAGRGGVAPDEAARLAMDVAALGNIELMGVMGVAPLGEEAGRHFARLREVLEDLRDLGLPNAPFGEMSAGMSADFADAIMHGATLVRIGRAVFGPARSSG